MLNGEGTPAEVVARPTATRSSPTMARSGRRGGGADANPDVVEKLKAGNMKPMGAIIGAVMKATRGQADAKAVTRS